jgi:hypothetical protein
MQFILVYLPALLAPSAIALTELFQRRRVFGRGIFTSIAVVFSLQTLLLSATWDLSADEGGPIGQVLFWAGIVAAPAVVAVLAYGFATRKHGGPIAAGS